MIALFIVIILDPSRIEDYDQFIVSFGGAAFAFYLAAPRKRGEEIYTKSKLQKVNQ